MASFRLEPPLDLPGERPALAVAAGLGGGLRYLRGARLSLVFFHEADEEGVGLDSLRGPDAGLQFNLSCRTPWRVCTPGLHCRVGARSAFLPRCRLAAGANLRFDLFGLAVFCGAFLCSEVDDGF